MHRFVAALLIVAGFFLSASSVFAEVYGHNPDLDYLCEEGFQWSRDTVACEQADCPEGANRTYTLDCNCGEAWGRDFRTCYNDTGLAIACVGGDEACPGEEEDVEADEEDENACDEAAHEVENRKGECECAALYARVSSEAECAFVGSKGLNLDADGLVEFEAIVGRLAPGQAETFVGKDTGGRDVRVAVLREQDGSYTFSADGLHYFSTSRDAFKPGVWTRVKTGWGDLWRNVGMFFGVGKYTGKDTAGDKEKQEDGQERLDAATQALENLQKIMKDPDKQSEAAEKVYGTWLTRAKNLLGEDYEKLVLTELKEATGVDGELIKKALEGKWSEIALDVAGIDDLKKKLFTFPAESVVILAKELRRTDFAQSASLYMQERQAGKTPDQIFTGLLRGELPELEAAELTGTGQQYQRVALFLAYEEAYQRYLLRNSLAK